MLNGLTGDNCPDIHDFLLPTQRSTLPLNGNLIFLRLHERSVANGNFAAYRLILT